MTTDFDQLPEADKDRMARQFYDAMRSAGVDDPTAVVGAEFDAVIDSTDLGVTDVTGATVLQPEPTVAQRAVAQVREEAAPDPDLHPADEANPAVSLARRIERPAGMPDVLPLHAMPRRKRAKVFSTLLELQQRSAELHRRWFSPVASLPVSGAAKEARQMGIVADDTALLADIADALVDVAAEGSAMRVWAGSDSNIGTATDAEVKVAFLWYLKEMHPGEAAGSQAS